MRQMRLAKENPNIFSFLCDCHGSGIVVLVHEIPDKASGEKPDVQYATWYFCTQLNFSACIHHVFQGMFKLEPECIPVPQCTMEQREIHRKTQAAMLRRT